MVFSLHYFIYIYFVNVFANADNIYLSSKSAPLDKCSLNHKLTDMVYSCRSQGGCSGGPLIYDGKAIGAYFESRTQMKYARSNETVIRVLKEWLKILASVSKI